MCTYSVTRSQHAPGVNIVWWLLHSPNPWWIVPKAGGIPSGNHWLWVYLSIASIYIYWHCVAGVSVHPWTVSTIYNSSEYLWSWTRREIKWGTKPWSSHTYHILKTRGDSSTIPEEFEGVSDVDTFLKSSLMQQLQTANCNAFLSTRGLIMGWLRSVAVVII